MTKLRRFAAIGIVAVAGVVCSSQPAYAGIATVYGYVLCHADSAAARYFYSRTQTVWLPLDRVSEWSLPNRVGRQLRKQSLQHLATEFGRYVAEHHGAGHLLFPHCELIQESRGFADETLPVAEDAGYLRAGVLVPYEEDERTAVDWRPDFMASLLKNEDGGRPGDLFIDCPQCPVMTVVPAGAFVMGSPASEPGRRDSEGPQRTVTVSKPFAVGVYEVTFEQWETCVRARGCGGYYPDDNGWGRERRPVIHVAWEDAQAYAEWLSSWTGEKYRLLSEAEWEYVARAGTTTSRYWGDDVTMQCQYANGWGMENEDEDGFGQIRETAPCSDYETGTRGGRRGPSQRLRPA